MKENISDLLAAEADVAEQLNDDDLGPTYEPRHPPRDPSQVYSVRIPVGRLEQLRRRAAEKGVAPSSLMRQWVIERLDADEGAKGRQSELEALVAVALAAAMSAQSARQVDMALWMVAREADQMMNVFEAKVFADEATADEEAQSSGGVVIPLPVTRDYRPSRKRALP